MSAAIKLNDGFVPTQKAIAEATRETLRRPERMSRMCRCCGARIPTTEPVFAITADDDPEGNYWRMCGPCWRVGYARGETVDDQGANA